MGSILKAYFVSLLLLVSFGGWAQKSGVEISGDVLEVIMPTVALGSTFIWQDETRPTLQFLLNAGTTFVVTHTLKWAINKPRPNGGDRAFPSGHTSAAFSSASFLERRYGWKVGIPSYILASYVGWTRIYANKHDIWDVLGGAALGIGSGYIFTKPYEGENITVSFHPAPGGLTIRALIK